MIEYARSDSGLSVDHEGDFIKYLIDQWNVDPQHVRIGVVVYHDTVSESIHIDEYANRNDDLKDRISRITRYIRPSGEADLAGALDFVRRTSFSGARDGAEKIVIPIVHEMPSSTKGNIIPEAAKLKAECINIIGIGVSGRSLDESVLAQAVTQPSDSHYQHYSSYTQMEYSARNFGADNC